MNEKLLLINFQQLKCECLRKNKICRRFINRAKFTSQDLDHFSHTSGSGTSGARHQTVMWSTSIASQQPLPEHARQAGSPKALPYTTSDHFREQGLAADHRRLSESSVIIAKGLIMWLQGAVAYIGPSKGGCQFSNFYI